MGLKRYYNINRHRLRRVEPMVTFLSKPLLKLFDGACLNSYLKGKIDHMCYLSYGLYNLYLFSIQLIICPVLNIWFDFFVIFLIFVF